jgi:hypothetical protein
MNDNPRDHTLHLLDAALDNIDQAAAAKRWPLAWAMAGATCALVGRLDTDLRSAQLGREAEALRAATEQGSWDDVARHVCRLRLRLARRRRTRRPAAVTPRGLAAAR